MRLGLRVQILLLLGGLMLLGFVPLHYAVATYSTLTLRHQRVTSARALGRAVASHIGDVRARRSQQRLSDLLEAELGSNGVEAIGLYGPDGQVSRRQGDPEAMSALPAAVDPRQEAVHEVAAPYGRALLIVVPDRQGAVVALLRVDERAAHIPPLVRLLGLYTAVIAGALLLAAYFALTRLIVRPVDVLARAAARVAAGGRRFEVPAGGPAELAALGHNLKTMTEALLAKEAALRQQIEEVQRATRELKEAQSRLVRSERLASVGRLAAGLAHEVGNPLAALIGMEDLLLTGDLSEAEQHDFLTRMRRETDRIHRILQDLLQFARPSSHSPDTPPAPGDVAHAIQDVVALVTPQRALAELTLQCDVAADLPRVALHREQVVQVLLNLVLNAADACATGGSIRISARASTTGVLLAVEDDGPGVPLELRERLFEPFVTTKEVGKGTGLGLAVCRGMVETVGGTIRLDPTRTTGARFVVELPDAPAPDDESAA